MLSPEYPLSNPILIEMKSILLTSQKLQREGNQCALETKEGVDALQPLIALLDSPEPEEMQLGESLRNVLAAILERITANEQAMQQIQQAQSALLEHQQQMLRDQRAEMQAMQASLDRLWSGLAPVIDAFCDPEGPELP